MHGHTLYHFFIPCRFRRKLFIILLGTTVTCLIGIYLRQAYHSISSISDEFLNSAQKSSNWTHSGKDVSSKFRRLTNHNEYSREHAYGYVVALQYSGQQGAGIQALMSLQCWAASFNLPVHILEPILNSTVFISIPHERSVSLSNKSLRFSDLFDIQHFNRISESIGYVSVDTGEDFFTSASRDVIYVHLKLVPKSIPVSERSAKIIWIGDSECIREACCYQFRSDNEKLEGITELKENYCVIRIIEVTYSYAYYYIFSNKEIREVIYGDRQPQQVTLIFSLWRTPWYVVNNELDDPHKCKRAGYDSRKEQFLPSPRLMSDTKRYENLFLNSSNEVAVMLRIEHVIDYVNKHREQWSIDKCLQEAYQLTRERQKSGRPMVTLDMGKFGSGVWSRLAVKYDVDGLTEKSKQLLNSLFNHELSFSKWEESFTRATGGVENSGYIAALQRTLASRAKCLILVGGGTFQDLALKDYLRNHPKREDRCVRLVCIYKNEELFRNIIHT